MKLTLFDIIKGLINEGISDDEVLSAIHNRQYVKIKYDDTQPDGKGNPKGSRVIMPMAVGSTKAGNLAHLYAGLCLVQTDKFQDAIDQLEKYSSCGDDMVSPSVIGTIGNCYAELGQNEKAVEMLVKAAKKADNNTLSPLYLIQAGQIYESLNQNDKALDCYTEIKTKYQQSMQYSEVDKYIERVKK